MALRDDPLGPAEAIVSKDDFLGRNVKRDSVCCSRLACYCEHNARALGLRISMVLRDIIADRSGNAGKRIAQLVRDLEAT